MMGTTSLFNKLNNNRGLIMVMTGVAVILLLTFGGILIHAAIQEGNLALRQKREVRSLHIAEAGLERVLYHLREDYYNDSTPSWADGDIDGFTVGPNYVTDYPILAMGFGGGTMTVFLKNAVGDDEIWVTSVGFYEDIETRVKAYARIVNVSPWDNAIFAGAGASGSVVNGNVDIRGSVHILGNGLSAGDYAIDLGGTAEIVGNNYDGLDASLAAKVPALPTTTFNSEVVETLNAELRVKKGIVGLSGSSSAGLPDVSGNSVKETVNGTFVEDGWGGTAGASNVFSDNGSVNGYDLGDAVDFPSLSDPHPDNTSATYQNHYKTEALVLTSELSSLTPTSSFSYSNAYGSISFDGAGNMAISGQVYVEGGNNVVINKQGSNKTITYTGTGTLLVEGNVDLNVNLVTAGNNSFPTNIIGIMTPNNISMNEAGIDVMGAFYAENQITIQKQTDVMGTVVTNYIDMGTNVPAVFQVPDLASSLPPGMIAGNDGWYFAIVSWERTK